MDKVLEEAYQALFEGNFTRVAELEQQLQADSFERLNLQSYLAVEQKQFEVARQAMISYLGRAQNQEDKVHEHIAYHQLGYIERSARNLDLALQWIEKEADFLQEYFPEDHYRQSVNLYEQGYLHLQLGKLELAEKWMRQALTYALESDDLINHACAYRGMGEIFVGKGDQKNAKKSFQRALTLFEEAGDAVGIQGVQDLLTKNQV